MNDTAIEVGADGQTSDAPPESAAVAGSGTDASVKQEPAGAEQGSQSAVAAPEAAAPEAAAPEAAAPEAAAGSAGSVTNAPDPAVGAEIAAETADGIKTEPPETPEAGGTDAPPAEGTEQPGPAAEGPEGPLGGTQVLEVPEGPVGPEGPKGPEGPEAAGADGDRAAPDQQQPADTVPQLVKVVHSARSVFRQRDVKEYDPFTAHLERRITKLFEALDTEETGRVDVHELGTLIRSVGCCPSETELQEMVTQLEEEGQPGFIQLATVMPYIIQCVEDRKYPSASAEQLLQAFQVLADDCAAQEEARAGPKREKKEEEVDTLPQDKLVHILTEEGEHFSQEEVEEMLSVVPASESARVQYREFVKQLVVPELW